MEELDVEKVIEAALLFKGTHRFTNFVKINPREVIHLI